MTLSLQDRYAPDNECFGCGAANKKGLQIKSFVDGDALVCEWRPEPHHLAFPGVLNGGICGTILDCHCNWTASWAIMRARDDETVAPTVTADYHITLKRVTPLDTTLQLRAWPVSVEGDRCVVEAELTANGKVTATCRATFVAVREGHPAYRRW